MKAFAFDPPACPQTILLIRHGQSLWNSRKRVTGQLDPGLSETGKRQALALAETLASVPVHAIYTSRLERTVHTAQPTAKRHGLAIHVDSRLDEIHHGILQGRYRDERDPEAQALWEQRKKDKLRFRFPGGENLLDVAHRVLPFLESMMVREQGKQVLIVGHRNTNRVILGLLLGAAPEAWDAINPRSRALYEIGPLHRDRNVQIHTLPDAAMQPSNRGI